MFRYLKAFWYMITGRFSAAAEALQSNKYVMGATYDAAIAKSADRFNTVRNAVASLIGIEEARVTEVQQLTARAEKLEQVKKGAAIAAKGLTEKLKAQGMSVEDIKKQAEFIKHMSAFNDASSTLAEVEKQIEDKEKEIENNKTAIASYKAQLQQMQRQNQSLRSEKEEAIADTQIAEQMQAINDVLAGVAENTTDKDLAAARAARQKAKAKAKITSELAGNDAQVAESEYLDYASKAGSSTEFDALVGLTDVAPEVKTEPAKLPE